MNKYITGLVACLLFHSSVLMAQDIKLPEKRKAGWQKTGTDLFGTGTVFIENIGQYGDTLARHGKLGKIKFGYEGWNKPVLFTHKGLIYVQRDKVITMEWLNANPHAVIVTEQQTAGFHTYGMLPQQARSFKKLTYKELYPGIDIEYSFPESNKVGFEYRIIARPGSDLNKVKAKYGGDTKTINKDVHGNLVISSGADSITESMPVSFYWNTIERKFGNKIGTEHHIKGHVHGFSFREKYDAGRNIIIDPFVTSTTGALTGINSGKVMEVDFDNNGNVYVNGGTTTLGQVAKFDNQGNLVWKFSGSLPLQSWHYGDNWGGFTVDKITGHVYVGQGSYAFGSRIIRLNSATGTYDNYITPPIAGNGGRGEIWKMRWLCFRGTPQIMIGSGSGGAGGNSDNIFFLQPPSTTFTPYNITGLTATNQDVSDFVLDPANDDLYTIFASVNTPSVDDRIYKNKYPYTAANQAWTTFSGYADLLEDNNTPYMTTDPSIGGCNITNILALNSSTLFYYDGFHMKAFDKATGAVKGIPITITGKIALMQQGVYADECNNVFTGSTNGTIKVYRFNGTTFDDNAASDISINGYPDKSIYTLKFDKTTNLLYAAGDGFVGCVDISGYCNNAVNPTPYTLQVNTTCSSVTGTINPAIPSGASVTYTLLDGNSPINNNTTGIFTGLTPGSYQIKADITSGCNNYQLTKQAIVSALSYAIVFSDDCNETNHTGAIAVTMQNGTAPFEYSMDGISFQTNGNFTGLAAGSYTLTIQDASGCMAEQPFTIAFHRPELFAGNDTTIVQNQPLPLQAVDVNNTGFDEYIWSPASGLNNSTIPNPVATIAQDRTYIVTAKTIDGCEAEATIRITVFKGSEIHVPNAFTPNGDTHNDIFTIKAVGIKELKHFEVFNRWGQRIFHTNNATKGWDGTWQGILQGTGIYVWRVEAVDFAGKVVHKKGTVLLIR